MGLMNDIKNAVYDGLNVVDKSERDRLRNELNWADAVLSTRLSDFKKFVKDLREGKEIHDAPESITDISIATIEMDICELEKLLNRMDKALGLPWAKES